MFKIVNFLKRFFDSNEELEDLVIGSSITKKVKILIDNGHGNGTKGKRSPYSANKIEPAFDFYEYAWNREIARNIVTQLLSSGYDAELLVPEEYDVSLSERVKRVNKHCDRLGKNNVIVVSIHANACGNGNKWEKAYGWEAYTSVGQTESDYIAEIFYKNAEEIFYDRRIRYDLTDKDKDREVSFYILKYTKCPAILTENFFYDNIDDIQFILSENGKEKIIDLHVKSIIQYVKEKEKGE